MIPYYRYGRQANSLCKMRSSLEEKLSSVYSTPLLACLNHGSRLACGCRLLTVIVFSRRSRILRRQHTYRYRYVPGIDDVEPKAMSPESEVTKLRTGLIINYTAYCNTRRQEEHNDSDPPRNAFLATRYNIWVDHFRSISCTVYYYCLYTDSLLKPFRKAVGLIMYSRCENNVVAKTRTCPQGVLSSLTL